MFFKHLGIHFRRCAGREPFHSFRSVHSILDTFEDNRSFNGIFMWQKCQKKSPQTDVWLFIGSVYDRSLNPLVSKRGLCSPDSLGRSRTNLEVCLQVLRTRSYECRFVDDGGELALALRGGVTGGSHALLFISPGLTDLPLFFRPARSQ